MSNAHTSFFDQHEWYNPFREKGWPDQTLRYTMPQNVALLLSYWPKHSVGQIWGVFWRYGIYNQMSTFVHFKLFWNSRYPWLCFCPWCCQGATFVMMMHKVKFTPNLISSQHILWVERGIELIPPPPPSFTQNSPVPQFSISWVYAGPMPS